MIRPYHWQALKDAQNFWQLKEALIRILKEIDERITELEEVDA